MDTSIIPFYLSKYAHSMRRLCQSVLVLALLLGNSGQVYSQECHAIYSVPNGFGKLCSGQDDVELGNRVFFFSLVQRIDGING